MVASTMRSTGCWMVVRLYLGQEAMLMSSNPTIETSLHTQTEIRAYDIERSHRHQIVGAENRIGQRLCGPADGAPPGCPDS